MQQPQTFEEYQRLVRNLDACSAEEKKAIVRRLCRTDLFFLLWFALRRDEVATKKTQWLIDRCKEVQENPDGRLDLWAREHYKSTIITFAKTIQDILASHGDDPLPEWGGLHPTFGIFSCTKRLATDFSKQIKLEFENNSLLKETFPDILWEKPDKQAPKWTEDQITVRRKSNARECTVEAWGLVEGMPTGKHFTVLIYDDVVTDKHVTTEDMIAKTTKAWELSTNLGSEGGKRRYIGTHYHYNDTYKTILKRGLIVARKYPATDDGKPNGEPVFMSPEYLRQKRSDMGPYTFSCQMLLDPVADENQNFLREWLRYHKGSDGTGLNKYIFVDPANEKKKSSDYTAMIVYGLGSDQNYYVLDMVRDRLSLTQRTAILFQLHQKWKVLKVFYEKYGMQADISHIKDKMNRENYNFELQEVGGITSKVDRIRRLIPIFEQGRIYLPSTCYKTNYQGQIVDLVDQFINEEYLCFPLGVHDDVIDCMSRVKDEELGLLWPNNVYSKPLNYPDLGIV